MAQIGVLLVHLATFLIAGNHLGAAAGRPPPFSPREIFQFYNFFEILVQSRKSYRLFSPMRPLIYIDIRMFHKHWLPVNSYLYEKN